tara:strand:+ start:59 stop:217 length:159 start_codon:yes stop_codon:yes gene_type:complete
MIDNTFEFLTTVLFSILILSGAGFVMWWGIDSTKRFCSDSKCCHKIKKKQKT